MYPGGGDIALGYTKEELQKFNENANLKEVLKSGKARGENTIKSEILAQDQYKQNIMDALLNIRRVKKPMEDPDTGEIILQEFVRLEDGSGKWKQVKNIPEDTWNELTQDGVVTEKGAKAILGHLNSISNNNVSLANLKSEEINNIGKESELSLTQKLANNREEYGIDSPDELEWIVSSVVRPNVMANLSKAKDGALIREILRETKLVGSLDDEDDDGGIFDSLK